MLVDDNGVVAAQLEQEFAHAGRNPLTHLAADGAGTGKRHEIDALVVDELAGEFVAAVVEQIKHGRHVHVGQCLGDDFLHGDAAQRCLRRGLPDVDVAADGGDQRVPRVHGDREIEGRNRADNAERMPLLVHAVLRPFRVHGLPVHHARLAHGKVGDVDHLLDFTVALGLDLAHLERHETAQRVLVIAKGVTDTTHGFTAHRRRYLAPLDERVLGQRDDLLVLRSARAAHPGDEFPGCRIV